MMKFEWLEVGKIYHMERKATLAPVGIPVKVIAVPYYARDRTVIRSKEPCDFELYFDPTQERWYGDPSRFWWDIDNDYMWWIHDKEFSKKFIQEVQNGISVKRKPRSKRKKH